MKTIYEDLRRKTIDRVNRIRRTLRIVESESFQEAWSRVTSSEEARKIEGYIALNQVSNLEIWLETRHEKTLDELSLRELRELAKVHAIPYYGSLTKAGLLWEISHALELRNRSDSNSIGHATSGHLGSDE